MTSIDYRLISGLNAVLAGAATVLLAVKREWAAFFWAGVLVMTAWAALRPEDESDTVRTRNRRTLCILILLQALTVVLGTVGGEWRQRQDHADYEQCLRNRRALDAPPGVVPECPKPTVDE